MALLEYKNVCVTRQEQTVLKDVNITVNEGDFVFLLGRVGSGKSSFLKSIYAEVPIASGEANVLGYDLMSLKKKQIPYLRRELGIIFQDFRLLTDRTVQANLEFVLEATGTDDKDEVNERIDEVLRFVGMQNKGYRMPHELSGGEQQRVVVARSLLNRPKILLADEPTGNLDRQTGRELMDLFFKVASEGMAVIMSTHNLAWTEIAESRVFWCEDGNLLEKE